MIVEGTHTFAAPVERVWQLLLDPGVMAKAMPGAKDLHRNGDGNYEGVIKIGVGPITAAEFSLLVTMSNVEPPRHYTMDIDSKGRFGFTRGVATVDLVPDAAGAATTMNYRADLNVGGKIAGVGQRLLDSISKLMTRQGLEALSAELERRLKEQGTGDGGQGEATPAPPPSSAQPLSPGPHPPVS